MSGEEYFGRVAGRWEEMRRDFFGPGLREKALSAAGVGRGSVVADIGAGSGFLSEGALLRGARVLAVDREPGMLEALARRLGGGVEVRRGESLALPLADGEADAALANMYLHHVEDPAGAIREMARVIRPGGMVVVTDLDSHEFAFLREEHHDRWMGFDRAEVEAWMRAAGLGDVRVDCANEDCCADSACGCASARVSVFLASGRKA